MSGSLLHINGLIETFLKTRNSTTMFPWPTCSEHAIGFLKGQFQSLKGLHINIEDEDSHQFATYWVRACITVHAFAMWCEAEEQVMDNNSDSPDDDPFIQQGLFCGISDSDEGAPLHPRHAHSGHCLQAARQW